MFRDPPSPSGEAIAADNAALDRATIGIKKAWEGQAKCILASERLKMMKVHESLHTQGHHKGRINLLSGVHEEYYISNLGSTGKEEFVFSRCSTSEECNKKVSRFNRRLASKKINIYLDRFLSLTSSMIPLVDQRDINEQSFRLLSFGLDVPKPDKFVMPSIYLAHMVHEKDVRLHQSGEVWTNRRNWKQIFALQLKSFHWLV